MLSFSTWSYVNERGKIFQISKTVQDHVSVSLGWHPDTIICLLGMWLLRDAIACTCVINLEKMPLLICLELLGPMTGCWQVWWFLGIPCGLWFIDEAFPCRVFSLHAVNLWLVIFFLPVRTLARWDKTPYFNKLPIKEPHSNSRYVEKLGVRTWVRELWDDQSHKILICVERRLVIKYNNSQVPSFS